MRIFGPGINLVLLLVLEGGGLGWAVPPAAGGRNVVSVAIGPGAAGAARRDG